MRKMTRDRSSWKKWATKEKTFSHSTPKRHKELQKKNKKKFLF